jgi:hypothetical protein
MRRRFLVDLALSRQPQVDLVNQRSRLQRVVAPLAAQVPLRQPPQFLLHQRYHLIQSLPRASRRPLFEP